MSNSWKRKKVYFPVLPTFCELKDREDTKLVKNTLLHPLQISDGKNNAAISVLLMVRQLSHAEEQREGTTDLGGGEYVTDRYTLPTTLSLWHRGEGVLQDGLVAQTL